MDQGIDIGMALRSFRIRSRINQAAIARTLGVSQSQVSRWEGGTTGRGATIVTPSTR